METEIVKTILILTGCIIGTLISIVSYSNEVTVSFIRKVTLSEYLKRYYKWHIYVLILSWLWSYSYLTFIDPYCGRHERIFTINYSILKNDAQAEEAPNATFGMINPVILFVLLVIVISGWFAVFGIACFGGFLVQLAELYKKTSKNKPLPRKWSYWVISCAMILAGGGLTTLYGVENVSALSVLQIGASAPLIINRFRK